MVAGCHPTAEQLGPFPHADQAVSATVGCGPVPGHRPGIGHFDGHRVGLLVEPGVGRGRAGVAQHVGSMSLSTNPLAPARSAS